jgi:nanoRNase/pAp phosphatase (c-di-AMP/oligoRNAs hydrolase)
MSSTLPPPKVLSARSRVRALSRHRGPDHPDTLAASAELRTLTAEEYIRKVVAGAPPLTDEQIRRLRNLLAPAVTAEGGNA